VDRYLCKDDLTRKQKFVVNKRFEDGSNMHLNIGRILRRSINVFDLSEKLNYTDMKDTVT